MANLQWNIYIARVGFVESGATKLRPVIVLSEPFGEHKLVVVAPIYSSKPDHKLVGDITIPDDYADLGLVKPSTIRLHRMVSLSASDLKEQLSQAPSFIQRAIKADLKKLFKL